MRYGGKILRIPTVQYYGSDPWFVCGISSFCSVLPYLFGRYFIGHFLNMRRCVVKDTDMLLVVMCFVVFRSDDVYAFRAGFVMGAQVKIMQDTDSPTLWGAACCVLLSGTMQDVMNAQQMILERIANISDRLKDMVRKLLECKWLHTTRLIVTPNRVSAKF